MLNEKRIKMLVREKEPYITLLQELDRTGKLRKARYKERVNFTIDEDLMTRFRERCRKDGIKMSTRVESLIREFLDRK